jgi:hypothetical protein
MSRILVVLAISVLLAVAPAGLAQAQLGGPQVPTPLTEPPPPPETIDSDLDDEGLSGLQQAMIFAGAALVLALIGFAILRDAKRAAPVDDKPARRKAADPAAGNVPRHKAKGAPAAAAAASDTSASAVRARERERAKRAKAKAKAARNQRKRNRPK